MEKISRAVGATVPELVSWAWKKTDAAGLARLDYTQNAINRTLVAPFSARPAAGAPVSVPITWEELDDPDLRPDRWTIRTVLDRLGRRRRSPGRPGRTPAEAARPMSADSWNNRSLQSLTPVPGNRRRARKPTRQSQIHRVRSPVLDSS